MQDPAAAPAAGAPGGFGVPADPAAGTQAPRATTRHVAPPRSATPGSLSGGPISPATIPAGVSDAEKTYAHLTQRLAEVKFDQVGFGEIVTFLRDVTGVNIVVNWRALAERGVERDVPVDLILRDATIQEVLRQVCKQAGGNQEQLGFGIEGSSIVITTLQQVEPRTRTYDVSDLASQIPKSAAGTGPAAAGEGGGGGGAAPSQPGGPFGQGAGTDPVIQLGSLLQQHVNPIEFSYFGGRLLIRATDMQHLQIDQLLADLRRGAK
jgi:hypothetical protein